MIQNVFVKLICVGSKPHTLAKLPQNRLVKLQHCNLLKGARLKGAKNLLYSQIRDAKNWEGAIYTETAYWDKEDKIWRDREEQDNQKVIEKIRGGDDGELFDIAK